MARSVASIERRRLFDRTPERIERQRQSHRLRRYGITPEAFDALLESQGGRCAVCRSTEPGGKGSWHADHDHETGEVRGALCHHCNLGLGNFKDDPDRLQAAIDYLRRH